MKKVGLVGGMGPESTVAYYKGIANGAVRLLGREEFPPVVIDSLDLFNIQKLIREERDEALVSELLHSLNNLKRAGAEFAALTANTAHIVFPELERLSPLPLISIIDATIAESRRRGVGVLGLLGTTFTMTGTFFRKPFEEAGIRIVVPDAADIARVHEAIMTELEFGIINSATLQAFREVVDHMKRDSGIEALILGCTELPLLLNSENMSIPCLDTMEIHVEAILRKMME